MKLIIAGSRTFNSYLDVETWGNCLTAKHDITEIVSGGAKGADRLGEAFAKHHKIPITRFMADWQAYGKAAGYRRNYQMAQYADILLVFWDGASKGTNHMINLAKAANLPVYIVYYNDDPQEWEYHPAKKEVKHDRP